MTFNRVLTAIVAIIVIVVGIMYFTKSQINENADDAKQETNNQTMPEQTTPDTQEQVTAPETAVATFTTNLGSFEVTLDGKAAPKTVGNFIKLANEGFYNNLTFHRIVQDFVIQGGDPSGDGTGGPGYTVPAEIKLKHTAGAIAMARTGDAVNPTKASSGSQFYIALKQLPELDGKYTVFGYVTSGMDVVNKIGAVPTEPNPETGEVSIPLQAVIIKSITIK